MDREDDCESAADMEGEHEDGGGDEGDYKLREDLIRELESRAAASPVKFSDIYQSKIIPTVEADKLLAFGVPVLDDFPTDSDHDGITQFRRAITEHGTAPGPGRARVVLGTVASRRARARALETCRSRPHDCGRNETVRRRALAWGIRVPPRSRRAAGGSHAGSQSAARRSAQTIPWI